MDVTETSPTARLVVCSLPLQSVLLATQAPLVAFACSDGVAHVARYDAARASLMVDTSADAKRIAMVTEGHSLLLYDRETRLVTRYEGQPGQISTVAVPDRDDGRLLIGDVHGSVRAYALPARAARVAMRSTQQVFGVEFSPNSASIVGDGGSNVVRRLRLDTGDVTKLAGHQQMVLRTRFARDGRSFLSFSSDGTVRMWPAAGEQALRVFAEHGGVVGDAEYLDEGRQIVSVRDDGKLWRWSTEGNNATVLFKHTMPLSALEVLAGSGRVVVHDDAGAVWEVSTTGSVRSIAAPDGIDITLLRASPDGRYLAVGTETGAVTIYATDDYRKVRSTELGSSIRQISFDPSNRDAVITTDRGFVRHVSLDSQRALRWQDLVLGARDVTYSPDGETIAIVCADGGTWFYAVPNGSWFYARDHRVGINSGRFSRDGTMFATADRGGTVVVRDVAATIGRRR